MFCKHDLDRMTMCNQVCSHYPRYTCRYTLGILQCTTGQFCHYPRYTCRYTLGILQCLTGQFPFKDDTLTCSRHV